ncbi:MAG TPA: mannosyltransferase [Pseudonocardiaceae bacterium]|jgi:alpha-1,2-mannosyltransferase
MRRLIDSDRLAATVLAVSLMAHFLLQLVPRTTSMIDLRVYRHASPGLFSGALYDFRLGEFSEQFPLPFTYPPFAALVLLPLSWLPWWLVRLGWQVLSIGCLYWIARCSVRLVLPAAAASQARLRRYAMLWTAAAMWFEPVRTTFNYGQVNMVLVAVLLSALLATRDVTAGLGVGLAAGVKLVPAVSGLYFLAKRRYAAAGWSAAWFVATVALTFAVAPTASAQYWLHLLGDASRIGPVGSAINQSLRGALARSLGFDVATGPQWLVAVAAAAVLAGLALRAAVRAGDTLAAIVVVQFFGLLVSPISWSHHWVWVLPALVWLVHGPVSARALVRAAALLWLLLVGSYLIPLLVNAQRAMWIIPRPWYLSAPGWAYPVAAVLTLVAMVVTLHRRAQPTALPMTPPMTPQMTSQRAMTPAPG